MLPNENLDTKNLNLTLYLFGPKKGEYYIAITYYNLSIILSKVLRFLS